MLKRKRKRQKKRKSIFWKKMNGLNLVVKESMKKFGTGERNQKAKIMYDFYGYHYNLSP